jgi:Helix-turn-helix of DDE superfamily endonuclease
MDEFETLIPAVEATFQRRVQAWTMEGRPRGRRGYSTYATCPLPTPEDRLLFILSYVKQAPTQIVQGALFGLSQSNANTWIHVLLPVLRQALSALGDAPARSLVPLQQRLLGQSASTPTPTATAALPAEEETAIEPAPAPASTTDTPFFTVAPSVPFRAPKTRLNRRRIIAARKSATQSKTWC